MLRARWVMLRACGVTFTQLTNLESLELCSGGLSDTGAGFLSHLPGAP
jgi:hypothetical protein